MSHKIACIFSLCFSSFFLFEISRGELYSVWQRRQREKKMEQKDHTDKSINLKIYITLYVVAGVQLRRHKTQSDTFKRLRHVHILLLLFYQRRT